MKVLVIGGSGFIGSHVAEALSDAGHEVTVLDRHRSPYVREDQSFVTGDILDREHMQHAVAGHDAVYHLAGIAHLDIGLTAPIETVEQNVLGTVIALEAARLAEVKRFVYASSVYVYSEGGSFYRCSKQAAELYVEEYQRRYGLDFTILRFGTVYGPRADRHNSVRRYLKQALRERRIVAAGTGDEIREYVHVKDAAQSSVHVLDDEFRNQRIVLTGHQPMRFADLLEMIREILGDVTIELQPPEPGDPRHADSGHFVDHSVQLPAEDRQEARGQSLPRHGAGAARVPGGGLPRGTGRRPGAHRDPALACSPRRLRSAAVPRLTAEELRDATAAVFRAAGAQDEDAATVAAALVDAELSDHPSHGLIRVVEYLRHIREGAIVPEAQPEIVEDRGAALVVDGNWGFGQVVATRATEWLIERTREHGSGAVGDPPVCPRRASWCVSRAGRRAGIGRPGLRQRWRDAAAAGALWRPPTGVRHQSARGGGAAPRLAAGCDRLLHRGGGVGKDPRAARSRRGAARGMDSGRRGPPQHQRGGLLRRRHAAAGRGPQGVRAVPAGRAARRLRDRRRFGGRARFRLPPRQRHVPAGVRCRCVHAARGVRRARRRAHRHGAGHPAGGGVRRGAAPR